MAEVIIGHPVRIYAPEVNDLTKEWGVYSIPRMWMEVNGDLVVRFGGEKDDGYVRELLPSKFFKSSDLGNTWEYVPNGDGIYDMHILTGINPPYLRRENGDILAFRYKDALPIKGIPYEKEYSVLNKVNIMHAYPYGRIPDECKGIEMIRYRSGKKTSEEIEYDFPEREVDVNAKALNEDKTYSDIDEYVHSNIFSSPYFTGALELPDGTLLAVTHGQNPEVFDRKCQEVYLVESKDDGITWRKRSVVASETVKYPNGYSGDGSEISFTRSSNGNLICAMRMEPIHDTMLSISSDNGYHWSEPRTVAESGVTPHVVSFDNGIVILIYGRPGVHFKVSEDNGITWGDSYPIIGKTLTEERAAGRADRDSMYVNSVSYSNTFVEKISKNSVLVLYNENKEFDDNGVKRHKAAYVRKITVRSHH